MDSIVPVTVITGFLGSGKTTLLNRLLKLPSLKDTAVIVNEFGEVGIDHLLVEQAIENAVLLKNGCVCCTVRGDIADTLELLFRQQRDGAIPPFRRIAIETTGLADPGPVAHTLVLESNRDYRCRLDGIVTTVDALHGAAQIEHQPEARNQVALADRIVLTKTDLAVPAQEDAVVRRIEALNASAPIRRVVAGDIAAEDVFGLSPSAATPARVAEWLHGRGAANLAHDHHHHHEPDRHAHGRGEDSFNHDHLINSTVLTASTPVAWSALKTWLDSILSLHGADILRLKGLVCLKEAEQRPLVLQVVHHVMHTPTWLPAWPSAPHDTQLVVINRGLSANGLRASFAAALAETNGPS